MFRDQRLDRLAILRPHVGNDDVLVWRQTQIAVVYFGNATQAGDHSGRRRVLQAAILAEQREMAAAIFALGPAVAIAGRGEGVGAGLAKLHAAAALDLGAENVEATILDGVFKPRVLAIG